MFADALTATLNYVETPGITRDLKTRKTNLQNKVLIDLRCLQRNQSQYKRSIHLLSFTQALDCRFFDSRSDAPMEFERIERANECCRNHRSISKCYSECKFLRIRNGTESFFVCSRKGVNNRLPHIQAAIQPSPYKFVMFWHHEACVLRVRTKHREKDSSNMIHPSETRRGSIKCCLPFL